MECSKCGAQNRDRAKFCHVCSTKLVRHCPTCQTELPGYYNFCYECGTQVGEVAEGRRNTQSAVENASGGGGSKVPIPSLPVTHEPPEPAMHQPEVLAAGAVGDNQESGNRDAASGAYQAEAPELSGSHIEVKSSPAVPPPPVVTEASLAEEGTHKGAGSGEPESGQIKHSPPQEPPLVPEGTD